MDASETTILKTLTISEAIELLGGLRSIYNNCCSNRLKNILNNVIPEGTDSKYEYIIDAIEGLMGCRVYMYSVLDILLKLYPVDKIIKRDYSKLFMVTTVFIGTKTKNSREFLEYHKNRVTYKDIDNIKKLIVDPDNYTSDYINHAYVWNHKLIINTTDTKLIINEIKQKYSELIAKITCTEGVVRVSTKKIDNNPYRFMMM